MPVQKISSSRNSSINVRDEREFKLWVKFIASVHKEGGDIKKPIDILWNSLTEEITSVEMRCDKVLS